MPETTVNKRSEAFFQLREDMERKQRKIIPFMRREGYGYKQIARELHLKADDVKKFCKKNRIGGFPVEYRMNVAEAQRQGCACMFCGMPIKQPKVGRKRRYCDSTCRKRYNKAYSL